MRKSEQREDQRPTAYCHFCGARPGEISERTEKLATAVYVCEKCPANYCDQCSAPLGSPETAKCLRCGSRMPRVAQQAGGG
jgi:hypothetical protein